MAQAPKKKVVKKAAAAGKGGSGTDRTFTPSPEAKSKATTLRIIAAVAWVIAIGGEIATIVWILPQASEKLWLLIVALVVIAVFALVGGLLWKKANRYDPASERNKLKFWLWNNLGMIMTVVAFLPLIVLILLNKDMDGKQKGIAAGIGAVLAVAVGLATYDWSPQSQEQYAEESNIIVQLTGTDEVFWVKGGSVFHVCDAVPDVNKESQDNQIYTGTVADAHADGKDRLTQRWESEATKWCGYTQEEVDAVKAKVAAIESGSGAVDDTDDGTVDGTDDGAEVGPDEGAEVGPGEGDAEGDAVSDNDTDDDTDDGAADEGEDAQDE